MENWISFNVYQRVLICCFLPVLLQIMLATFLKKTANAKTYSEALKSMKQNPVMDSNADLFIKREDEFIPSVDSFWKFKGNPSSHTVSISLPREIQKDIDVSSTMDKHLPGHGTSIWQDTTQGFDRVQHKNLTGFCTNIWQCTVQIFNKVYTSIWQGTAQAFYKMRHKHFKGYETRFWQGATQGFDRLRHKNLTVFDTKNLTRYNIWQVKTQGFNRVCYKALDN